MYRPFDFKTTENISQSRLRAVPPHERRYGRPDPPKQEEPREERPVLRQTSEQEFVKHVQISEEPAPPTKHYILRREKTPSPEPVIWQTPERKPSPEPVTYVRPQRSPSPEPVRWAPLKRRQSPVKQFVEPQRNPSPEQVAYVPPYRQPSPVKQFVEPIRKPSPQPVNPVPIYALPKRKQSPVKREPERNPSPEPVTYFLPPKVPVTNGFPMKKAPLRKQSAEHEKPKPPPVSHKVIKYKKIYSIGKYR